jgi:putative dehydrogenase
MSDQANIVVLGTGPGASALGQGLHGTGSVVVFIESITPRGDSSSAVLGFDEAIAHADLVIVQGTGPLSVRVAERTASLLRADGVFADLSPGAPAAKTKLSALYTAGSYTDVMVLNEDAGSNGKLRVGASGPGARKFIEFLAAIDVDTEYVSDTPGGAAGRGLLRDLLAKGMAGVIVDCLWAAQSIGQQEWAYREILDLLESASAETAKRLISGTATQVKRREMELLEIAQMLRDSDYKSPMISALQFNYGRILHGTRVPFGMKP